MEYTGAIGYYVVESGLGIWGPDISTGLCIGLGLYRLYIYIIKIKNVYIYICFWLLVRYLVLEV